MDRGACRATVHGVAESDTTERLTLSLKDHKQCTVKIPNWRVQVFLSTSHLFLLGPVINLSLLKKKKKRKMPNLKKFLKKYFKLCIFWLCWVLVVAQGIYFFSCGMRTLSWGMWDLVLWPGIEPGLPALGVQSPSHWTTRKVPQTWKLMLRILIDFCCCCCCNCIYMELHSYICIYGLLSWLSW